MVNTILISNMQKNSSVFSEVLNAAGIKQFTVLHSIGEARRYILSHEVELIMIDAPLTDESGERFARETAANSLSQVILAVNSEHFYAVAEACEKEGVLTISKPLNREMLWSALSLARAANAKIKRFHAENAKLKQKIEDIRVIDRAKCLLISYVNLSEQEAHRFIEKQAMDLRSSKVSIAQEIIKTYGN